MKDIANSKPVTILTKIFDLAMLSLLWLLCCLPLLTIGASTSALYYTAVKYIRRDEGSLLGCFLRSFRMNLGVGVAATAILSVAALLCYEMHSKLSGWAEADAYNGSVLYTGFMLLILVFAGAILYVFPLLSRFTVGAGGLLTTSFVLAVRHPVITLGMLAVVAAGGYACYALPVLLFIVPGAGALLCSLLLERVFTAIASASALN